MPRDGTYLELHGGVLVTDLTETFVRGYTSLEPDHAIGVESEVDLLQSPEALDQQPCPHEQHERQRDLRNHERTLHAPVSASSRCGACDLERSHQALREDTHHRDEPEHERRDDRDRDGK